MALDPFRREIPPEHGVTPDWRAMIENFSASITAPVVVSNVTDRAQLVSDLAAAGWAPSSARPLYVHRVDRPGIEWTADGSTWAADGDWMSYTPTCTWTVGSGGSLVGMYAIVGDVVHFAVHVTLGTSGFNAAATLLVGLPVAAAADQGAGLMRAQDASGGSAANRKTGVADIGGSTATPISSDGTLINGTTPWTWAAGDDIRISGTYRKA